MSGISDKMFKSWLKTLDPNGIWIRDELIDKSAVRIWCILCAKHLERLRSFHNFSDAFVNGITGSALKRDALPFKMGAGKWPLVLKLGHNIWICSGRIFDNCPSLA